MRRVAVIRVRGSSWHQQVPDAANDVRTLARVIEIATARWVAGEGRRTVRVEADDGEHVVRVVWLRQRVGH